MRLREDEAREAEVGEGGQAVIGMAAESHGRARFRGYVGPGALARYRADLAAGVAITPPAPP